MSYAFRITIIHAGQRQCFKSRHTSGGAALSEICTALGIEYPSHASIVRIA